MTTYDPHALATVFPRHSREEGAALSESLAKNGQREDIVLLDSQILDGFGRYTEGSLLGMTLRFRDFGSHPSDGTSATAFVVDKNLARRHLSLGQRAAAAEELVAWYEKEALTKTEATAAAAAAFGVSAASVKVARKLKTTDSTGFEKVKRGEKTLNAAQEDALDNLEAAETAMNGVRAAHSKAIHKVHGEAFGIAFDNGVLLKTAKEIDAFTALQKEDQKLICELIVRGWAVNAALKFMLRTLDGSDKLESLALQAAGVGKPVKVLVNGYVITARKASDSEAV